MGQRPFNLEVITRRYYFCPFQLGTHNLCVPNYISDCNLKNPGTQESILFSGDLGAPYAPLLPAPKPPHGADLVVLEITFGDRLHKDRKLRKAKPKKAIELALQDRGVILIPAFSIGRTQVLLYEIEDLINRNHHSFAARDLPWQELEIILDSLLASRFTTL